MNEALSPQRELEEAVGAMERGDAQRAIALAQSLCNRLPNDFRHHQVAGIAALDLDRNEEALAHFRAALRCNPLADAAAAAWSGIGQAQLGGEEAEEAEVAFRRALSLAPRFGPALAGLANAVGRLGRHREAELAGREALKLGVQDARLHIALGHALLGQGKLDEAEAEFRMASALAAHMPEPRFGLGSIAKIRGRLEEAERIYREVLETVPAYPGYEQFAGMKTFARDDPDLALLERCRAELPADSPRSARADLHFALAKAYDDIGDAEHASEQLRAGNDLERQRMAFDPDADEALMRRIEEFFTPEFVARYADAGLADIRPIFVVSLPRSGSTLTEQMLAAHSRVRGGGELGYLARVINSLGLRWGARADFPNLPEAQVRADLREAAQEYARLSAALRLVTPYFTDKSLNNFRYLGLIRTTMVNARIVHVRRHPLATALGLYRLRFARGIAYSNDLDHIVHHYRAYAGMVAHWRRALPGGFYEVFYETLVTHPERELRRVLDYIGLDFEPACLEFHKLDRPVRTASVTQVRTPLNTQGIARHERYRKLLAPVAEGLAAEIADYERALAAAQAGDSAQ